MCRGGRSVVRLNFSGFRVQTGRSVGRVCLLVCVSVFHSQQFNTACEVLKQKPANSTNNPGRRSTNKLTISGFSSSKIFILDTAACV